MRRVVVTMAVAVIMGMIMGLAGMVMVVMAVMMVAAHL